MAQKYSAAYINKLSEEKLRDLLYAKAQKEKEEYIANLKTLSKEEIIKSSYKQAMFDEFLLLLEQDYLNKKQLKFLLQFESPLALCYDAWLKTDVTYMDILYMAVSNLTEGLIENDMI